jgi:uncharacterized membrane protein
MRNIVSQSCGHGTGCPMYGTINFQTYFSLAVAAFVFFLGVFFLFVKPEEKIIIKKEKIKIPIKKKKINLQGLDDDEKKIIELLINEGRAMFQRDLMEKLEIGKVKTTRLLDKLEAKQFIERKRRGMNNIVVLKD